MADIDDLRRRLDRRFSDLKEKRNPWEDHWRELADYNAPQRLRIDTQETKGQKRRSKILDSTSTLELRTLAAGMHSGITSPSRPWFRFAPQDPDLKDNAAVKLYLSEVELRMRSVLAMSNAYTTLQYGYGDLGLFGQWCGLIVPNGRTVVRMMPIVHGQFWIARDVNGVADTLYRQLDWTVERIVSEFGYEKCPIQIKNAYDTGKYDDRWTVNHAIEPRRDRDRQPGKIDGQNKVFASVYWLDGSNDATTRGILKQTGFDANPIICPPWEIIADDDYAHSPGQEALPDVKQLMTNQRQSGEAIEKKVRPPMTGPTSMRNNPASLMPGSITYVDATGPGAGYRPAIEMNFSVSEVEEKINQTQIRISRAYYSDLFRTLANLQGVQPRNEMELAKRNEESLLQLGPVLENIYYGQNEPILDRTFEAMIKAGKLPPAPAELQGRPLEIEYISTLAQAQKAVATGSIERLFSFVGNLAAINPTVLDKLDMDEGIDQYADMLGAPPSVVVPDDVVAKTRQARADKQAKAENLQAMAATAPAIQQGADAAKLLSETDAGGGSQSLLSRIGIAG